MAIQVVQGLIDTGRQGSQSTSRSTSSTQNPQSNQSQIQVVQTAQAAALTTGTQVSQTFVASEATLITVRAGKGTGDSAKIRDAETARHLADSVAEDIRDYEDTADGAHRSLSANNAREHFA